MSKNKGLIKQGWGGLKLPDFEEANDFWLLDPVCSVDNIYTIHPAGHWSPVWNGYMMPVRDYLLFFVVAAHHHSGIPRPPVQHHGQLATWGLLQASLLSLRNYVWSHRLKYVWACLCSLDCNRKENISAQYESVYFKICVMRLTLHSQQIRKNCWWSGFV